MKRIVPLCLVSLSTLAVAQEAPTSAAPMNPSPAAPAAATEAPTTAGASNPASAPAAPAAPVADVAPGAQAPAPTPNPAAPESPAVAPASAAPAVVPAAKSAAPVASTPAVAPAAPAAKPAAPAAKAAPASPAVAAKPAEKPASDAKAEGGSSDGVQFHPGLSFGTVTVDGKTWTRLSLQPEIEIGKLGVALDLEVFMDEKQDVSSRGWEFGSTREGVESVLRKIYYVRWDKPGAPFYAKVGALDDVTLAHGLTVNNYRNTARYPDYKLLGLHSQLNDISSLGLDAEVLINSFQDFSTQGPFWAGRLGFRPLKMMGMPIFKDLKVGGGVARDESQYSGLRDRDRDGCPDQVDAAPGDGSTCVPEPVSDTVWNSIGAASVNSQRYDAVKDSIALSRSGAIKDTYGRAMSFTQIWFDATLPLISTSFFELGVYGEYAKPLTPDDDSVASLGWGAIPVGAWSKIGPVDLTAEYRMFRGPFQPGWFDAAYEIDRARQSGKSIVPKTEQVYGKGASTALLQGYFAGAHVDLWGMVEAGGDYSQLVASTDAPDLRSMSGKVGLGKSLLAIVKNKVSKAEIYWRKDRIGLDTGITAEGTRWKDSFFGKSVYNAYGWRLGSQVAGGVELTVQRETNFTRDENGRLKSETQMAIASQMSF